MDTSSVSLQRVTSLRVERGTQTMTPANMEEVLITFPDQQQKKGVIVKLKRNKKVQGPLGLHLLLTGEEGGLPHPKLIISVTGGADRAQVTRRMQKEFRRGLIKAASSTEAWIVTGGTDKGVMKQVGLAARAQWMTSGKMVPLIGIAPLREVELDKYEIVNKRGKSAKPVKTKDCGSENSKTMATLDCNHSHFILVDSGSTTKEKHFEAAINVRVLFEKEASQQLQTRLIENGTNNSHPLVGRMDSLIGPGLPNHGRHLDPLQSKKEDRVPIVLVMFEGGKDTLTNVHKALKNETPVVVIKGSGRAADVLAFAYEEKKEKGCSWGDLKPKVSEKCTEKKIQEEKLEKCVSLVEKCLEKSDLLTVFELTSHTSVYDVDKAILQALLAAKRDVKEQTRLAIIWNRFDIARSDIDIQSLKDEDLKEMTTLALKNGRADFLDMFLDIEADLDNPSQSILAELFLNSETSQTSELVTMICQPYKARFQKDGNIPKPDEEYMSKKLHELLPNLIGMCGSLEYETSAPKERTYLLWAVLMNRMDLALIFWREGKEKTLAALVVYMTLMAFAECSDELNTELKTRFKQQAEEWGRRAGELLVKCHEVDEEKTRKLLVMESDFWRNSSCVLTALRSDNKHFASLHPCRALRRLAWRGHWPPVEGAEKPLLSAVCGQHTSKVDARENQGKVRFLQGKLRMAPRTVYHLQWVTYLLFLVLYSYMVLVELDSHFTWVEGVISVYVFAIAVDVIVQFKAMERPLDRLAYHLKIPWTVLDLVSILTFALGFFVWLPVLGPPWVAGRVLLALALMLFFLRFLYYFTISRFLGPKLIMFGRMLSDLAYLSVILFVFICGYAITSEAILYPNTPLKGELLYTVTRKAFWQVFGEFFLEDIEGSPECTSNASLYLNGTQPRCPSSYGRYIVPILMAMYILITNLLLLNLIIAMFSHTFTKVQEETELHWQFLRMRGMYEMTMRSTLPLPFSLLNHTWNLLKFMLHRPTAVSNPMQMKFKERQDLIDWEDAVADAFLIDKSRTSKTTVITTSSQNIAHATAGCSEA